MNSLADLKRAIKPGMRLLCHENSKRPELNGKVRIVIEANTVGFNWRHEGDTSTERKTLTWTRYEKASRFQFDGSNTFTMAMVFSDTSTRTLRLEVLS